jgi:uncharacterized protein (DUF305 family)
MNRTPIRVIALALPALVTAACASAPSGEGSAAAPASSGPRIVQPGAPGEQTRDVGAAPLDRIEGAAHTEADVAFMQGMIHHHAQALRMTALVPERTANPRFHQMARRIEISQNDEIAMMRTWLRDRGLELPDVDAHAGMLMSMPGMLTDEQMRTLRDARGADFERHFLQFMIQHHGGALVMVNELFATPGAAQESTVNFFANEVDADQTIEIRRMQQMLQELR